MTRGKLPPLRNLDTVRYGQRSRWLACLLALLVVAFGRPGLDIAPSFVSERDVDPVEQEESESEEELAIHCRNVFRRRAQEQKCFAALGQMIPWNVCEATGAVSDPAGPPSPHDFDLRNGLGAVLRC
jgi:hypothetical protein